jgi:hypothetical protein
VCVCVCVCVLVHLIQRIYIVKRAVYIHTWNSSNLCLSPILLSTFSSLFQQRPSSAPSLCDAPSSVCSATGLWGAVQRGALGNPCGIPDHSHSNTASTPAKVGLVIKKSSYMPQYDKSTLHALRPKRSNREPLGATRQQAIAKTLGEFGKPH